LDIERVLGVDECCHAAAALAFGDGVQCQCGFAARLRAVDFDDSPPWVATASERVVQGRASGADHRDGFGAAFSEGHNGALAELFFNVADGFFDGFELVFYGHSYTPGANSETVLQRELFGLRTV
jgi:hypothetical protein